MPGIGVAERPAGVRDGPRRATLSMVFKLTQAAERRWRRLTGSKLLMDVILGVRFIDGIKAAT